MTLQFSRTNLRTLQVLQDADRLAEIGGLPAQSCDDACVLLVGAVRKIQASDIHAKLHQLAQSTLAITRRPDGADDFRPASVQGVGGTGGLEARKAITRHLRMDSYIVTVQAKALRRWEVRGKLELIIENGPI